MCLYQYRGGGRHRLSYKNTSHIERDIVGNQKTNKHVSWRDSQWSGQCSVKVNNTQGGVKGEQNWT